MRPQRPGRCNLSSISRFVEAVACIALRNTGGDCKPSTHARKREMVKNGIQQRATNVTSETEVSFAWVARSPIGMARVRGVTMHENARPRDVDSQVFPKPDSFSNSQTLRGACMVEMHSISPDDAEAPRPPLISHCMLLPNRSQTTYQLRYVIESCKIVANVPHSKYGSRRKNTTFDLLHATLSM